MSQPCPMCGLPLVKLKWTTRLSCPDCGIAFRDELEEERECDRYDAAEEKADHEYHFAKDEGLI